MRRFIRTAGLDWPAYGDAHERKDSRCARIGLVHMFCGEEWMVLYKRSNYPRASFVVSILLICGYNLFVSLTLPSAEQQEIREIMINEAPLPVNPGTVLVADQRDVDVDEPAQSDQTARAALH